MGKLLLLVILVVIGWRLLSGRWLWERGGHHSSSFAQQRARSLLGVRRGASRKEVVEAHRRLVARVHPDKGGSSAQIHEANEARDLLLRHPPKKEHS